MNTQQAALDHLRVIRSLMEKAHIYRALSAPAALVGGLLALVAAGAGGGNDGRGSGLAPLGFLVLWLGVLAVAAVLNLALLARDARRRGQPFVSAGMRMALRALLPPLLAGGVLGAGLIVCLHSLTLAVLLWCVCYGLALLATASFSPRSLIRLGWLFLLGGLGLFGVWAATPDLRLLATDEGPASWIMGGTFGLFHVGYALAVFFSRNPEAVPAE